MVVRNNVKLLALTRERLSMYRTGRKVPVAPWVAAVMTREGRTQRTASTR
jgi:hypothetical protein